METAGRKIPGHGYVVAEICQTENPFPFHLRRDFEVDMINETFYFACIYDTLNNSRNPGEKPPILNHPKAKTVRLHSKRVQSILIDTHEATLFQGESPSIFRLHKMRKRRVSRMITSIIDKGVVT